MPQAPPTDYLTTAEAAQILGVSTSRVRQLVAERRLRAWKRAGWWVYYSRADVERLNDERKSMEEKR